MEQESPDGVVAPFSRKSRYILVVDGNTNELFYTAMLLQRFAYPVCTARTARMALDMVAVAVPALVVTDQVLPGMSGSELLRVLGSTPRTFSVPVILLVSAGETGLGKQDYEGRATLCLPKPTPVEELFRAVQKVMEQNPRTNIRIRTMLPVSVNRTALNSNEGECVTHLSAHGMYIRTLTPFSRNEEISVSFEISGRTITADAKVLYNRGFGRPLMEQGMAIKFVRMLGEDRQVLTEFIHDEVTRGIVTIQE